MRASGDWREWVLSVLLYTDLFNNSVSPVTSFLLRPPLSFGRPREFPGVLLVLDPPPCPC